MEIPNFGMKILSLTLFPLSIVLVSLNSIRCQTSDLLVLGLEMAECCL